MIFEGLMGYNFRTYNPKQPYLLPPALDDWLPQNYLAAFSLNPLIRWIFPHSGPATEPTAYYPQSLFFGKDKI